MAKFTHSSTGAADWGEFHFRVPARTYFWNSGQGESVVGRKRQPVPQVYTDIAAVPGIQSFYLTEGYELKMHKAASYEWEEIRPAVEAAIDAHDARNVWPVLEVEPPSAGDPEGSDYDSEYDYDTPEGVR